MTTEAESATPAASDLRERAHHIAFGSPADLSPEERADLTAEIYALCAAVRAEAESALASPKKAGPPSTDCAHPVWACTNCGVAKATGDLRERARKIADALSYLAIQQYGYDHRLPLQIWMKNRFAEMVEAEFAAIRAEVESTPVKRLYDALYAMMYGWGDDGTRLEAFAALQAAAPFLIE